MQIEQSAANTAETIAQSEFPQWNWTRPVLFESRLPLLLYLKYHDRGSKTITGDAASISGSVGRWIKEDRRFDSISFDGSPIQISKHLMSIVEVTTTDFVYTYHVYVPLLPVLPLASWCTYGMPGIYIYSIQLWHITLYAECLYMVPGILVLWLLSTSNQ